MATYTKFDYFVEDLMNKLHDLQGTGGSDADQIYLVLSNTAPTASTNHTLTDITQIANGNGYTTDGEDAANVGSRSGTTVTVTCTNITWTASGTMADFRYVVAYNTTATANNLICYWDYGSTVTLNDAETFTVKFNGGASSGTLFTIA
jgi:hypothetical protein